MPFSFEDSGVPRSLIPALKAISNLTRRELNRIFSGGQIAALSAHHEIKLAPVGQKTGPFYRHLLPLREQLVLTLGETYHLYFKLALAHPGATGRNPEDWAWLRLQPALGATPKWLRDWYILACDGENQWVRNVGSTEFIPGQTVTLSIPPTVPPLPLQKSWRASKYPPAEPNKR